jgi:hypothetical protein
MLFSGVRGRCYDRVIMTANGFTLFDTAIGRCGISWSERGIVGVQLPEAREPETRARLLRHHPEAIEASPPPDIQRALDGIVALLAGEAADLSIVVPCHRVLAASGKVGGFSANGGIATKLRMLSIEAARTSGQGALFESAARSGSRIGRWQAGICGGLRTRPRSNARAI